MNAKATTARNSWQWREVVWNQTLPVELAVEVLHRIATAPELDMLALELRGDTKGLRWLVATSPRAIDQLKQLTTTHAPVRVLTPRRVRAQASQAARVTLSGAHTQGAANVTTATIRAMYGQIAALEPGEHVVVQVLLGRRASPALLSQARPPGWMELLLGPPSASSK